MRAEGFAAAILLAALVAPAGRACAAPLDAVSARAFVEQVYAGYRGPAADTFAPLSDATAPRLFEPSTAKLIAAGSRAGEEDEVGPLDFDPICACQDAEGIDARVTAQMTGPAAATATADIRFPGQDAGPKREVRFDLVAVDGEWRIHDLHEDDLPSLRDLMARAAKAK